MRHQDSAAVGQYAPTGRVGLSGGMLRRPTGAFESRTVCSTMHRRAGWGSGCRAVRRRAAGGCRRYAPSSLRRGVRRAGWGCRAVCTDEQARGNWAVCTDGPGGAVGRQYALTGRVGLSGGMHRRPGGGNQEVLTDGPGGAVE